MKIAVDVRRIRDFGVGTYIRNLLSALAQIGSDHDYALIARPEDKAQFAELPDDVVFTVEYSVRSAQIAVYTLLPLPEKPSPFYKGQYDPKVMWEALETLHR